jgi:nucleotide-binding universal stress UspA family protein
MERQLRAQASHVQRALAVACERKEVVWSFHVVRGEVAHEIVAAAQDADVLILGKVGRPLIRKTRLGSTALAAAVQASCCVLLLRRDTGVIPPIVVMYDGSPASQRALRIAVYLAKRNGEYLAVLAVADTPEKEYRLEAETADWLRRQGLLVRYRHLLEANVPTLLHILEKERGGTLILSNTILHLAPLQKLLDAVDCPVLLVR